MKPADQSIRSSVCQRRLVDLDPVTRRQPRRQQKWSLDRSILPRQELKSDAQRRRRRRRKQIEHRRLSSFIPESERVIRDLGLDDQADPTEVENQRFIEASPHQDRPIPVVGQEDIRIETSVGARGESPVKIEADIEQEQKSREHRAWKKGKEGRTETEASSSEVFSADGLVREGT